MIDEASRDRFIYAYNEQSSHSSKDFLIRSIIYFGYIPITIQTDNGFEFTYSSQVKDTLTHPFGSLCNILHIEHKLIRPRKPRYNGKIERSHRNDNDRFYLWLSFFSLEDLNLQLKSYLKRFSVSLNWLSPYETRLLKTNLIKNNRFILKKFCGFPDLRHVKI